MNIITGIHQEANRVREIIKEYERLPEKSGAIGAAFMREAISRAEGAIESGDVVEMLKAYQSLKEYTL